MPSRRNWADGLTPIHCSTGKVSAAYKVEEDEGTLYWHLYFDDVSERDRSRLKKTKLRRFGYILSKELRVVQFSIPCNQIGVHFDENETETELPPSQLALDYDTELDSAFLQLTRPENYGLPGRYSTHDIDFDIVEGKVVAFEILYASSRLFGQNLSVSADRFQRLQTSQYPGLDQGLFSPINKLQWNRYVL